MWTEIQSTIRQTLNEVFPKAAKPDSAIAGDLKYNQVCVKSD